MMFTFYEALLWQLENSLYGLLFIFLAILVKKNSDDWKAMLESETFTNKYFVAYLASLWFLFFPWLQWYWQLPRHGIFSIFEIQNPYIMVGIRIMSGILLLLLIYRFKKKPEAKYQP